MEDQVPPETKTRHEVGVGVRYRRQEVSSEHTGRLRREGSTEPELCLPLSNRTRQHQVSTEVRADIHAGTYSHMALPHVVQPHYHTLTHMHICALLS